MGNKKWLRDFAFIWIASVLVSASGAQEINKLSAEESKAGYDLLFNGVDFTGWHTYKLPTVTSVWGVKSTGPLGSRLETTALPRASILTNKKYKNFDVKIDVQTTPLGNSGVFFRYEETAQTEDIARSGPEFQVCGSSNSDCDTPFHFFGACYGMFPVKEAIQTTWMKPPGSWNQIRIVAFDSNYVHYGNGKKLLEYKIGSPEFLANYGPSKYSGDGNFGRYYHIHPGGILLQHHGELGITYRNLKAMELNVHPFSREFPNGIWPDSLPQSFVFGSPPTSISTSDRLSTLNITARPGALGTTLITVSAEHSAFQVFGIDGRILPFEKIAEGIYSLRKQERNGEIAIVRIRVGGKHQSKIIHLQ